MVMKVRLVLLCMVSCCILAVSCAGNPPEAARPETPPAALRPTAPKPETAPTVAPKPAVPPTAPAPAVEPVPFDPSTITKEEYDTTKAEVQALIRQLNDIIRAQDYQAWVSYLEPGYLAAISDQSFLERISDSARMKTMKISLHDTKDYFMYVVVPSRANDRVDDIEFIGENRVKAFTVTANEQRLRLYDLEKTEQGWKIVN